MPERPRRRIPGATAAEDLPAAASEPARPRFRGPADAREDRSRANAGWGAVETLATSDYTRAMKLTENWLLIKFLQDAPFDSFKQHWFPDAKGQKGWRCLNVDGKTACPLCDRLGDRAKPANSYFNVAAWLDGTEPTLQVLRAPKGLTEDIKGLANDTRFKGLTDPRLYACVQMKPPENDKGAPKYKIEAVRERDLADEWDITTAPTAAELAEIAAHAHVDPISDINELSEYEELADALIKQA